LKLLAKFTFALSLAQIVSRGSIIPFSNCLELLFCLNIYVISGYLPWPQKLPVKSSRPHDSSETVVLGHFGLVYNRSWVIVSNQIALAVSIWCFDFIIVNRAPAVAEELVADLVVRKEATFTVVLSGRARTKTSVVELDWSHVTVVVGIFKLEGTAVRGKTKSDFLRLGTLPSAKIMWFSFGAPE
jgi:hypothetical protein